MKTLSKLTRSFRSTDTPAKIGGKVGRKYKVDKSRIIFTAKPRSESTGEAYKTKIGFRVKKTSERGSHVGTIKTDDGTMRYEKPSLHGAAKVSCNCRDYLYTFAKPNEAVGAHLGKAPMLEEVKGKGVRAPRNPKMTPGSCKHIQGLAKKLVRKHMILE